MNEVFSRFKIEQREKEDVWLNFPELYFPCDSLAHLQPHKMWYIMYASIRLYPIPSPSILQILQCRLLHFFFFHSSVSSFYIKKQFILLTLLNCISHRTWYIQFYSCLSLGEKEAAEVKYSKPSESEEKSGERNWNRKPSEAKRKMDEEKHILLISSFTVSFTTREPTHRPCSLPWYPSWLQ